MSNKQLEDGYTLTSRRYGSRYGKKHSEKTKQKIADVRRGTRHSEETKQKISVSLSGKNHPFYGKKHTEKSKKKMAEIKTGRMNPNYGIAFTQEHKDKITKSLIGKNSGQKHGNWRGGVSYEPYCEKFNFQLKEEIRNRDNRTCQYCGKSEILNGARLSVHHINSDKMQGCNNHSWSLISLCKSCHGHVDNSNNPETEFLLSTGGG